MTSEEHRIEIERIVEENAKELMASLEIRKNDSEWQRLFIRAQFSKVVRELRDNDNNFINS